MKSLLCLLLQLLLAFAFSLHQILAESPPGFISLDCGLPETNGYEDSITGLYYSSDEAYIETGESRPISPQFRKDSLSPQLLNVRSFPGPQGSRNCYTLKPLSGKGSKILLRVSFMYGNYDDQSNLPEFDLHLGVDFWKTVKFKDSSLGYFAEILHTLTSNYLYVCLVNTGRGTPFISTLELRPTNLTYNITTGSLSHLARWDCGLTTGILRYKDGDPYDRLWKSLSLGNTSPLSISETSFQLGWFPVPPNVMRTACQSLKDSITFSVDPDNASDQVYFYLYFAELVSNQSRLMTVYLNGLKFYGPFAPAYLSVFTVYTTSAHSQSNYEIQIKTTNLDLSAILNAFEFYTIKHFPHAETNDADVSAIISIKKTYGLTSNWQGDPCSRNYTWIGINCSYNGFESPNIISLNLSSSGLAGIIAPSISNLTRLQSLDLSYNKLTGRVPDFLSQLPLTYLNLKGNSFSDSLPPALLEKSNKGSLILSIDTPSNKTRKKTPIVPIVASVAGFISIFILSTVSYIIIRRRRQASGRPPVVKLGAIRSNDENNGRQASGRPQVVRLRPNCANEAGGALIESNLRQPSKHIEPNVREFTFAEVKSFMGEKSELLGKGGFGKVYRGCMDGVEVAIKLLDQGEESKDFKYEVEILAKVHHRNLSRILGYCYEGNNRAIIFELMENGNLRKFLSDNSPSWEQRLSIMIDAAQGLEYLHHHCNPPIIHRDIKPANILLTRELVAKIADFGLSRIFPVQTLRLEAGTPGYYDRQCLEQGVVTEKVDIYSFGVVMLVVVTGQHTSIQQTHITDWVAHNIRNGDIGGIVDSSVPRSYNPNVVRRVIELAMNCVSRDISSRPSMQHIVRELEECMQTEVASAPHDEGGSLLNLCTIQ